jgi:Pre-toxin TG
MNGPRDAGPPDLGPSSEYRPVEGGYLVYPPGGPDEVFVPESAFRTSENFIDGVDAVVSVIPVVGDVKDVVEFVTGHRLIDGQELSAMDRGFALIGAIGVVGDIAAGVRGLSAGAKIADRFEEQASDALKMIEEARSASAGTDAMHYETQRLFDAWGDLAAAKEIRDQYGATGRFIADTSGKIGSAHDAFEIAAFIASAVFGESAPDVTATSERDEPEPDTTATSGLNEREPSTEAFDVVAEVRSRSSDLEGEAKAVKFDIREDLLTDAELDLERRTEAPSDEELNIDNDSVSDSSSDEVDVKDKDR